MSYDMESATQIFLEESLELLTDMEDSLLYLENTPEDTESLNAVFRAAHTIKGSAGVFGFDNIVEFTHVVENALDKMRAGEIKTDAEVIANLLKSCDHITTLVKSTVSGEEVSSEIEGKGKETLSFFEKLCGLESKQEVTDVAAENEDETKQVEIEKEGASLKDTWHISLRFGSEVLRNGMDPASFIRYLSKLGEVVALVTMVDKLPDDLAEFDPELCYLGFEVDFKGDVKKEDIEQAFEFVKEDCEIRIIPPDSQLSVYADLIRELPEDDMLIGEILLKGGAITKNELNQLLDIQEEQQEQEVETKPLGEMAVEQGMVDKGVVDVAVDKQKETRKKKINESRSVRVDAEKLDDLINLVGELVIASASANMHALSSGNDLLVESMSNTLRLVEEMRDTALRLRMVQIGETFNRFQRVVRDTSRELQKDIKLVTQGGETELDKTVVEKIGDPLMHLVRNAMDHGIESAEVRRSRGKPEQGTVTFNAYHDSGSIVIEVGDDGGGLDKEKILNKATERGLVKPNQSLSDGEIYQLIFEAGFSTAQNITNISGRGVGMDVVKKNIQALRGSVEVESELGVGTTLRIRLPLTLAIIDGFLVGVGDSAYVVPLDMVVECVDLEEVSDETTIGHDYINLRGEVLPFIRLREMFEEEGKPSGYENIVVVQYAGKKAGLVVDTLKGEFQTVIKPLGKIFRNLRGVSGATILGSGEVAIILDVPLLVQQSVTAEARNVAAIGNAATSQVLH